MGQINLIIKVGGGLIGEVFINSPTQYIPNYFPLKDLEVEIGGGLIFVGIRYIRNKSRTHPTL